MVLNSQPDSAILPIRGTGLEVTYNILSKHLPRPVESVVRRFGKLGLVLPISFLFNLSIGLINFAALFFLRKQFGASTATIGLFAGVWNSAYLLGCMVLRPIVGRVRPRVAIAVAPVLVALLVGGLLQGRSLVADFLLYACAGFSVALFWPPLMGWLTAGLEGRELAQTTSWYNLSWSIGNIASPLAAGLLVESTAVLPFLVSIGLLVAVGALTIGSLALLPDRRRGSVVVPLSAPIQAPSATGQVRSSRGTPYRIPAWIGLLSAYLFLGVLLSVFPLYAHYRLGISEGVVGLILVSRALSMTFAFGVFARATFWHFRTVPMAIAQVVLAGVCLLMPVGQQPWFFVIILPFAGVTLSLVYTTSLFHGISGVTDRSGRAAVNEAILTAGMVLGSALGGWIYQLFSMRTLFRWYALLLLVVAVYQIWFGFRVRPRRKIRRKRNAAVAATGALLIATAGSE